MAETLRGKTEGVAVAFLGYGNAWTKELNVGRSGNQNGNWKGGISHLKRADDLLNMPTAAENIMRRILLLVSKDTESGCWVWTGAVFSTNGRARLTLGRNNHGAHRLSYVLFKGSTRGLNVLHTCDNVLCVNPAHLWLGTNSDNSKDMVEKGRQAAGELNGGAKLTWGQVNEIRGYVAGRKGGLYGCRNYLAEKYGVCAGTISVIIKGSHWRTA